MQMAGGRSPLKNWRIGDADKEIGRHEAEEVVTLGWQEDFQPQYYPKVVEHFKPRTVQVLGGLPRLEYGGCWRRSRTRGREVDWEAALSGRKEGQCLGTRSRGDEKGE